MKKIVRGGYFFKIVFSLVPSVIERHFEMFYSSSETSGSFLHFFCLYTQVLQEWSDMWLTITQGLFFVVQEIIHISFNNDFSDYSNHLS